MVLTTRSGRQLLGVAVLACVLPGRVAAQPQPAALDTAAVPYLDGAGRGTYSRFLLLPLPRAAAIASNGKVAGAHDPTAERSREHALSLCAERGGIGCAIYAEDYDVVWQGRPCAPRAQPPETLINSINYAFAPDARFLWRGPQAAAGVFVWSHGQSGAKDSRGLQPPPLVRLFNNAGFDVVRFDRHPNVDTPLRAVGWLRGGLTEMRRLGYRRVLAGGQSRGGWTSLEGALDQPGLVDGVIATSPGAHGWGSGSNLLAKTDDLQTIARRANAPAARVVYAQFRDDPRLSDGEADALARVMSEQLRPRVGAVLLLDRPEGFSGHGAADGMPFAVRYGSCLLRFVLENGPAACP